jgi:hypothetical protein
MAEPRTVAGQAALSGMRPYVRRALGQTILTIETEAAAPYVEALRESDRVLEAIAAHDPASAWDAAVRADLVRRAQAAHQVARTLLTRPA